MNSKQKKIYLMFYLTSMLVLLLGFFGTVEAQNKPKIIDFEKFKEATNKIDYKKHQIDFSTFEKELKNSELVVLDLRSESEFKEGHFKGARNLGSDIKEEKLKQLVPNKDSKIVIYCTYNLMPTRRIALTTPSLVQIIALGYPNVYVLEELWTKNMHFLDNLKSSKIWEK